MSEGNEDNSNTDSSSKITTDDEPIEKRLKTSNYDESSCKSSSKSRYTSLSEATVRSGDLSEKVVGKREASTASLGSKSLMDQDSVSANNAPQSPSPQSCKTQSCCFFGSSKTEGYCSVCYKDIVKQNSQSSNSPMVSAAQSNQNPGVPNSSVSNTNIGLNNDTVMINNEALSNIGVTDASPLPGRNLEKSVPISIQNPIINSSIDNKAINTSTDVLSSSINKTPGSPMAPNTPVSEAGSSPGRMTRKRPRCGVCKKKIGLTGFDCRCGGMFCPNHRYTDQHNCSYDYRTEERAKLRKDNPVVEHEKIEKI